MADLLVGLAALHGHPPAQARGYAWRDLELIQVMHHITTQRPED
jgi:hypothetical protein